MVDGALLSDLFIQAASGIVSGAAYDGLKRAVQRLKPDNTKHILVGAFKKAVRELAPSLRERYADGGDVEFRKEAFETLLHQRLAVNAEDASNPRLSSDAFVRELSAVMTEAEVIMIGGNRLSTGDYQQLIRNVIELAQVHLIEAIAKDDVAFRKALLEHTRHRDRQSQHLINQNDQVISALDRVLSRLEHYQVPAREPGVLILGHMPPQNVFFTGRQADLEALSERLYGDIQVVHGLGGVGKTQLVREFVRQRAINYEVTCWVRAEAPSTLVSDLADLADRLHLTDVREELSTKVDALRQWLERTPGWLIVFDNAEKRDVLRAFLPSRIEGKILITSRNPNWGTLARPWELKKWTLEESAEFLEGRLGFSDVAAFSMLSEQLEQLPLALEQAAAYVVATGRSVQEYNALFRNRHEELWASKVHERVPEGYNATVATTWLLSMEEVRRNTPEADDLLRLCSFFGPELIPLPMLALGIRHLPDQLAQLFSSEIALDDAVAALAEFSLLRRDQVRGFDFLTIHRLVQLVVRDGTDTPETWYEIVLKILRDTFPHNEPDPGTFYESALLASHMTVVADYASASKADKMLVANVMERAASILYSQGHSSDSEEPYVDAETLYARALSLKERFYPSELGSIAATLGFLADVIKRRAKGRLGRFNPKQTPKELLEEQRKAEADLEKALNFYSRARSLARDAYGETDIIYAWWLSRLGSAHTDIGCFTNDTSFLTKAEAMQLEALDIVEDAIKTNRAVETDLDFHLNNLAQTYRALGNVKLARVRLEQCRAIFERNSPLDSSHFAAVLVQLGYVYYQQRIWWRAAEVFNQARSIYRGLCFEENYMSTTYALAQAYKLAELSTLVEFYMFDVPEGLRPKLAMYFSSQAQPCTDIPRAHWDEMQRLIELWVEATEQKI